MAFGCEDVKKNAKRRNIKFNVEFKISSETKDETIYELIYNHVKYILHSYHDGKYHNNLYECDKEIPEELTWFVDTIIRRELDKK